MTTEHDALTNEAVPRTNATLTIRIVKSFEYRTEKHLILHNINCETTTVGQLKELARQGTYTRFRPGASSDMPCSHSDSTRMEAVP